MTNCLLGHLEGKSYFPSLFYLKYLSVVLLCSFPCSSSTSPQDLSDEVFNQSLKNNYSFDHLQFASSLTSSFAIWASHYPYSAASLHRPSIFQPCLPFAPPIPRFQSSHHPVPNHATRTTRPLNLKRKTGPHPFSSTQALSPSSATSTLAIKLVVSPFRQGRANCQTAHAHDLLRR